MNHLPSLAAAVALAAALVAAPASADPLAAQDQPGTAATTDTAAKQPRELDVLIVTGATDSADRWASDTTAQVPEIADSDWVPAQSAPAN